MKSFRKTLVVATALAALAPSPLFACAACYGKSDSPLASGMNWGIFTLMGVILTVLTCVALFFVHVVRGEQAQIEADNNPPPQNLPKV
jgi:heme/copper-type cytochrome/quinol oxidase subunit 2